MSLLDEFKTSTPRPLWCGCNAEEAICECGAPAYHGGQDATKPMHKTACKEHGAKN